MSVRHSSIAIMLLLASLLGACTPAAPAPAVAPDQSAAAATTVAPTAAAETAQPTAVESAPVPAEPTAAPAAEVPTAAPARGGIFVRAMTSEPATIDPQGAPSSGLSLVLPYLFDTLVVRDTDNSLLPLLAESWDVAPDGKTITMTLRSDVVFHDGEPLTADTVRLTFERFKESGKKSPIYGGVRQISGIDAADDLTVRFTFDEPAANFWSTISMPYAGILSPASIAQSAAEPATRLVGTGPFTLGDWQTGQSMTLVRNEDYAWGPALNENRGAPYLDQLVFKVIPDATTQLAALEAGEVDVIFINQPDHLARLQQSDDVRLHEAVLNSLIYLGFNTQKAPFDDARVRQALAHAVNKDEILSLALGGVGIKAFAPLPPTLPGFDESLAEHELGFDPAASASLLGEVGFAQGSDGTWQRDGQALKAVLLTSTRAPNDAIAALVQSQLKAVGVEVEIQQLDSKAVMEATTAGNFDLLVWRYDWNDPDALNIYLGSDRIGSTNRVAYGNPAVDDLLGRGARELDEATRQQLYVEAQKLILADAPWQPLYVPLDVIAISTRIEGARAGYMGRLLVNDAYVVE
jgi:peptide/nickel transport system substrate-binding protein